MQVILYRYEYHCFQPPRTDFTNYPISTSISVKNGILLPKLFSPTVRKIVLVIEKKLFKFEAEGREFAKILRSIEQVV